MHSLMKLTILRLIIVAIERRIFLLSNYCSLQWTFENGSLISCIVCLSSGQQKQRVWGTLNRYNNRWITESDSVGTRTMLSLHGCINKSTAWMIICLNGNNQPDQAPPINFITKLHSRLIRPTYVWCHDKLT